MAFARDTQIVGSSHYDGAQDWLQKRHERRERDRGKAFPRLQLRREKGNPYDGNAIAVLSSMGIKLGHVPRAVAVRFAFLLDRGYDVRAFKTRETWASMRIIMPGSEARPRKSFASDAGASVDDELAIL